MVACGPPEATAAVMGCGGGTTTTSAVGVTEAVADDDDAVAAISPLSQPLPPPASVPWCSTIAADAGEPDADGSTRGIAWSYAKARKSSSQSSSIGATEPGTVGDLCGKYRKPENARTHLKSARD